MTTYRIFDGQGGRPGAMTGNGDVALFSSPFEAATGFEVTADNLWLQGYWWWVTELGTMPLAAGQKFCLWQAGFGSNATYAVVIPAGSVTAGALTAGAWNFVPLTTPIMLSKNNTYVAATAYQPSGGSGFWEYKNQWGLTDPWAAGFTNGPLTFFSDQSGSLPAWQSLQQGLFNTPGTPDPATAYPGNGNASSFFGVDVQVTDQAPAGQSYEIWPSLLIPPGSSNLTSAFTGIYTLATEFILSQACTLNQIRFFSPSDAAALPTRCGIWNVNTTSVVAGTDNAAPSWLKEDGTAAAAGVGRMIHVNYSGVTLQPGKYKTAVFYGVDLVKWFADQINYFAAGSYPSGIAASGIVSGPITAPNEASSDGMAQCSYHLGSWGYPATSDTAASFWVDVNVTPVPVVPPSGGGGGRSMLARSMRWADL